MKKIVALALCLVMIVGLMTGCQKPMDAKTLVQKMEEVIKNADSYAMEMDMELEMKMSITGMTLTMGMDMGMDLKAMSDMSKAWYEMNMSVEALGQSEETKAEMYMTTEDGTMVAYTYMEDGDIWVKTGMDEATKLLENMQNTVPTDFSKYTEEQMTLAKERETRDGKDCYVLTIIENGSSMEETFRASMESAMAGLSGEDAAMLEKMDFSALTVTVVYYVDAKTFAPVEMTLEIEGFGEMMNEMFSQIMAEAMMGTDEEVELSVDIPTCKAVITEVVYGGVEIPAVPQEAIDNAVDAGAMEDFEDYEDYEDYEDTEMIQNLPQADGSYLLNMDGDTVRVVLPEGWACEMSDEEMLTAATEDYSTYASYTLFWGYSLEEELEEFQSDIEFAKELDYYVSHTEPVEIDGFTVVSMVTSIGLTDYYAFKEMDNGILEIVLSVESDDAEILNTVLANVQVNGG